MNLATAIVVARAGSVRLPNKAMLPFAGTTLIGHKVRTLLRCKRVGRIVVGSDSDAILAEAERHGATPVKRDAFHCDETRCSANEMISHMVGLVPGDDDETFMWAHPTNPLVRSETYDGAIEAFEDAREYADSLMSVREEKRHAWSKDGPLNHCPWIGRHQTASDLSPIAFQDGAIFIQTRSAFLTTAYFYGREPLFFPLRYEEGWDIDTETDYRVARALCESQSCHADLLSTCSATPLALTSLSA
jgi:CMP-N,N'-diacetyllegionaminic acid synthase